MVIQVVSYRLRGGQVQPYSSSLNGTIEGFIMQTFGAEKVVTDIYEAKEALLASSDFQGQKPTTTSQGIEDQTYIDSTYARASYQGRPLRTTDGTLVYSANEEHVAQFIEESEVGTA